MKNPINRIAQEAPGAAPAPDAAPAPAPAPDMGGGMDMGAMMGGMGAPPAAPMAGGAPATESNEPILAPLETLGAILKDINVKKILHEQLSNSERQGTTGEEEIANFIWRSYGGSRLPDVFPGRVGQRAKGKLISEPENLIEVKDYDDLKAVENRWIRLPEGKSLKDLEISLENIISAVQSISLSDSMEADAASKGGGGGAMASVRIDKLIRIAHNLDMLGFYDLADKIL